MADNNLSLNQTRVSSNFTMYTFAYICCRKNSCILVHIHTYIIGHHSVKGSYILYILSIFVSLYLLRVYSTQSHTHTYTSVLL